MEWKCRLQRKIIRNDIFFVVFFVVWFFFRKRNWKSLEYFTSRKN